MVLGVGEIRHEQADGHRGRRGARQRQALYEEAKPAWPSLLAPPDPREAAAQGPTLPRLLPGGVGASGGGDAYDAERAAHQAAVHGQEFKPRGQEFGVGIRRSSHDAESEATAVLSPFISLYPLNTCVHACYWHGVVCWSQSLMYYSIN